jgi:hypothetical protein
MHKRDYKLPFIKQAPWTIVDLISLNMILERHIVRYSEYNNSFPSSQFLCISIRRVYFTTCFGRKGPPSSFLHTLFLH